MSWLHVLGEVSNGTSETARSVRIGVRFFDAEGRMVGTAAAYLALPALAPGGKSCFHVFRAPIDSVVRYEFSPPEYLTAPGGAVTLSVLHTEGTYDDVAGWYRVTGALQNTSAALATSAGVIGTAYDGSNTVVRCDVGHVEQGSLMPDESSPFAVVFLPSEAGAVATFRVQGWAQP